MIESEQDQVVQNEKSGIKVELWLEDLPIAEFDKNEVELLGEVRMVLLENPFLKICPNFSFCFQTKKLKEFEPMSSQVDPSLTMIKIDIVLDAFNDRTAKLHVARVAEFFENPRHFMFQGFLEFNNLLGKNDYLQRALISKREPQMKQNELASLLSNDMSALKNLSLLTEEKKESTESFFVSLSYSKNNPPFGKGKIQGDIFYLDLVTLEKQSFCLTVNRSGLFVNGDGRGEFNIKPQSQIYKSLLDLVSSLSLKFKEDLEQFYDLKNPSLYQRFSEEFEITKPLDHSCSRWLKEHSQIPTKVTHLRNLREILKSEVFGHNFVHFRDWNEEYQNSKTLPSTDTYQQIQKIKLLKKTHSDFLSASQELSKAIINDSIAPLNPSENTIENCYVFNNLFATYALDSLDWELPKTESSPSTYTTINNDMKNLKTLFELDLEGINTINTCSVEYLGRRIIVQTVIQGILHFDQNTWNCYGTIDDGKTMTWNEDFHKQIGIICQKFNLTLDSKFLNSEGKEYFFHGSPEVKGIKAGDGRRYLMDLMRLSPRDANYDDVNKHECCVLRPELLKSFFYFQSVQQMYESQMKLQEAEKLKEKEQTQTESKETEETPVEGDPKIEKESVVPEENKTELKQEQPLEKPVKTIEKLNPSLLTQIISKNENLEQEMEDLKEVSLFLKNNVISVFVNNMCANPNIMPVDMEGLVDSMHKNGINLRYLGHIHGLLKGTANHQFSRLIERTVFVRAFVKFLRKISLQVNSETIVSLFLRFTNILLGNQTVRDVIEGVSSKQGNQQNVDENRNKAKKAKKNKKKKQKKQNSDIQQFLVEKDFVYFKITSKEFVKQLKTIVGERYGLRLEESWGIDDLDFLKNSQNKTTFLRELCLYFGVQLAPRKYCFEQTKETFEMPVTLNDVTGTFSQTKSASYYQDVLKLNNKTIENEIQAKNYQGAIQLLQATQNIIINTHGIYNKEFIFNCSKIASILFQLKEYDQAVSVQTFVIQMSELVYGLDHFNTAYAFLELSNFLYEQKKIGPCIQMRQAALFIFDVVGSSFNSNSFFCLHELQVLVNESQKKSDVKMLLEQLLDRHAELFGQTDERLLYFLEKLAQIKAEEKDFEQASLMQARYSLILGRVLKNSSHLNEQYKQSLAIKLQESEKYKKHFMGQRVKK